MSMALSGEHSRDSTLRGSTPRGRTPKGCTPKGCTPRGCTPRGCTPRGCTPKGSTPRASTPKGFYSEGLHSEGLHSEGLHSEGLHSEGLHSEGFHSKGFHSKGGGFQGFLNTHFKIHSKLNGNISQSCNTLFWTIKKIFSFPLLNLKIPWKNWQKLFIIASFVLEKQNNDYPIEILQKKVMEIEWKSSLVR